MARRLPPSSSSSLTVLSHLLARALDEVVASAGPALRIRPKFFEGGWGNFFVDFSKDELVSSLSQFEEEKRLAEIVFDYGFMGGRRGGYDCNSSGS